MKHIIVVVFIILGVIKSVSSQSILGIDVSHWNGNINWNLVMTEGYVFAYAKATEGMTFKDNKFSTYMLGGKNAGMIMGAYHFARPDNNSPEQDANNFLNTAKEYTGELFLPPVLDLEDVDGVNNLQAMFTSSQLTSWVTQWLTIVENETGVKPIIYTNSKYANYLGSSVRNYGLWIAKPGTSPNTPPTNLGVWQDWTMKQYSWEGTVAGISGDTDLNVFNGNAEDFLKLIGIDLSNISDITVSNASVSPQSVKQGEQFTASANHNYSGNQLDADLPSFDLDYVLSTDCVLSSDDIRLGGDLSGLGSDDPTNAESDLLTIPTNTTPGQYYILFVGDADDELQESNEDNNIECVPITVLSLGGSEDIFITDASISPDSILPGGIIRAASRQNYNGNVSQDDLPNIFLYYYLSSDCTLSGEDIKLGDDFSGIGNDDPSDIESESLTIPEGTKPGSYFILFVGDATDNLAEGNEDNNIECVPLKIIDIGASDDITVSNASVSPQSVKQGEPFTASANHNYSGNQLDADLPSFDLDYVLSTDCVLSSDDIRLGGDLSGLGSDDPTNAESDLLTIPTNTTPGQYYILFVGDADDELQESNEDNNVECVPITVLTEPTSNEDITLTNATISSNLVAPQELFTVSVDQNYSGENLSADLPNFDLVYYLSTDCILNKEDIILGTSSSNLGSNHSVVTESAVVEIPKEINFGEYFILFVGEASNVLDEVDENNNTACLPISIIEKPEDISISDPNVSPQIIEVGGSISISANQNYVGFRIDNQLPNFILGYFLSKDCTLSNDDIFLDDDISRIGIDYPSSLESSIVSIPDNVEPGDYNILFLGDADNELDEKNEENNVVCIPISIIGSVSINSLEIHENLTVYPNPVNQTLYFLSEDISLSKVEVYNKIGQRVFTSEVTPLNGQISFSHFPEGIYYIKFHDSENRNAMFKIGKL